MPGNSSANAGGREGKRKREREREVIVRCMYTYMYLHFSSQFPVMANVLAAKEACTGGRERERGRGKGRKRYLFLHNSYIHYQYSWWVWPQKLKLKTKNYTITKYSPSYSSNPPLTSSSLSLTFWINKMEYVSIILYHVHLLHCLYGVH